MSTKVTAISMTAGACNGCGKSVYIDKASKKVFHETPSCQFFVEAMEQLKATAMGSKPAIIIEPVKDSDEH